VKHRLHSALSAARPSSNRKNAKKSTGPKTVEGRNVVRRNALKHGLTAETLVVEGEDAEAFRLMADEHIAVFGPATPSSSNSSRRSPSPPGGASAA
jgi:hypothetical protein